MSESVGRLVVVGAVLIDDVRRINDPLPDNFDGKVTFSESEIRLGGAGGNLVLAARALDRAFGVHTHVDFFTRLGNPANGDNQARIDFETAHRILSEHQISHTETSSGPCRIAHNVVVEHSGGRLIAKDPIKNPGKLAPGIQQTLATHIAGADVTFVDPRKFRTGPMAADICNQLGKNLLVDFGESAWPEDPILQDAYTRLLTQANIAVVPSDAVVEGMEPHKHDPNELFTRLQHQYGCENILMSNGGEHVRILVGGEEDIIEIEPHQGQKFATGIGDTRNAGVLWAISRGADMRSAFEFGTAIANIKIGHHRDNWESQIVPGIKTHPLTRSEGSAPPSWAPHDNLA